jgi:putative cardiolipin synthase
VSDVAPHDIEDLKPRLAEARRKFSTAADALRTTFPYHLPESREEALAYLGACLHGSAVVVTTATEMLFDDPRKGDIDRQQPSQVRQVLAGVPPVSHVLFVNPYFVPQHRLLSALCDAGRSGIAVRVLTNSLASTDVVAVHAHYAKRRDEMLKGGVDLCELRHDAEDGLRFTASDCRHATLALHGKVIVVDSRRVLVGSMNLDPRSHRLNTEDGLMIDSPELARLVEAKLGVEFEPTNCWRLSLADRQRIVWSTRRGGAEVTEHSDPDASIWKRIRCLLFGLLPIEGEI